MILLPQPPEWLEHSGKHFHDRLEDAHLVKKKKSSSLGSEILSQRGEAGKEGEVQETRRCEQAQSRAPGPAQAPRVARTSRAPGGGARPAARPRPLRPKPPPLPSHCAARARRCVRPRPPGTLQSRARHGVHPHAQGWWPGRRRERRRDAEPERTGLPCGELDRERGRSWRLPSISLCAAGPAFLLLAHRPSRS